MKQFLILFKDNLATSLKSKKTIFFLALYVVFFALAIHVVEEVQQEAIRRVVNQGGIDPELYRMSFNFMVEFLKLNSNDIVQSFLSVPFFSIELFIVMLLGTPALILMIHYDKLAQENYDGTFRYYLFRTSRAKIYWSKFASALTEIALITLTATIIAVLYGHFKLNNFDTLKVLGYSLKYWLAGITPLLAFSSMVFMFSSWVKRPFLALLLSAATVIGAGVIMNWYPWISPFNLDYWKGLFVPGTQLMLNSVLIYLGYTAFFSTLGFLIFKKRDL